MTNILIIHFNTPELTTALVRSIDQFSPGCHVYIFDNSDRMPYPQHTEGIVNTTVTILDNTHGQIINFDNWLKAFPDKDKNGSGNGYGSAKHCKSVDTCFDLIPEGFILLDSDVLLQKDIRPLWDTRYVWVGEERTTKKWPVKIPRLSPFICYINVPMCRKYGVRYHNDVKNWFLTKKSPECWYDTGAWFLEDCRLNQLPTRSIDRKDYIIHYGAGSWRKGDVSAHRAWLEENKELWDGRRKNGVNGVNGLDGVNGVNGRDVKIYICTHTDFVPPVHHPVYEVVDARAINNDHAENGLRGSFYSELMTYKWLLDHVELPDIVGFCHYRKYYSFMSDVPDIATLVAQYGCITTRKRVFKGTVYEQYARWHNPDDMEIVRLIVQECRPDMFDALERMLHGNVMYTCNMYILRKEDLKELIQFVFEVLDRYVERVGTDIDGHIRRHAEKYLCKPGRTGTAEAQYRIGGYLGERLASAWIMKRYPVHKEYDMVVTGKPVGHNHFEGVNGVNGLDGVNGRDESEGSDGGCEVRVALCAIGRMENRYAKEFVGHYRRLGFAKVYIYDNNHGEEEHFEEVLQAEIDNGFVEVVDWRDRIDCQTVAYEDCYARHGKEYDWMAFFDFDEFLVTEQGFQLSNFLGQLKPSFDCVLVNWQVMTDNGLIHYDPRPMMERFTEPLPNDKHVTYDFPENMHVKSIVRGGLPRLEWRNPHVPSTELRCCNMRGKAVAQSPFMPIDHSFAYLRHFTCKTIEEWLTSKVQRGYPDCNNAKLKAHYIEMFFARNERTKEKEEFIKNGSNGVNGSNGQNGHFSQNFKL